jgi:hypothetical protein
MRNQIGFARAELSYRGSLFYGYPQLRDNTLGVTDEIRAAYAEDVLFFEKEHVTDVPAAITVTVPYNNFRYDEAGTYLLGQSNPADTLFCNGRAVSRTKSGYFSFYTPLSDGANTFVFTQNGEEYTHTVWKNASPPKPEPEETTAAATTADDTAATESTAIEPILANAAPTSLTAVSWRDGLSVSVVANAEAAVTASLGDVTLVLTPGEPRADGTAVFSGKRSPFLYTPLTERSVTEYIPFSPLYVMVQCFLDAFSSFNTILQFAGSRPITTVSPLFTGITAPV